jgi:hypothetical protein
LSAVTTTEKIPYKPEYNRKVTEYTRLSATVDAVCPYTDINRSKIILEEKTTCCFFRKSSKGRMSDVGQERPPP